MTTALVASLAALALTALLVLVVFAGGSSSNVWSFSPSASPALSEASASSLTESNSLLRRQLSHSLSLVTKGNNGSPSSAFPLGECQGDCDSDADCAGDLVCFQRNGKTAVPGCQGSGTTNNDYCIKPTTSNSGGGGGNSGGGGGKALKMYWQQGYTWQEETFERKWCMRCDSSRQECSEGREIYITHCDRDMTSNWNFVSGPERGSYLIKLSASNLCIRAGRWLTVSTCNANNRDQLWNAVGGTLNNRFELRPVIASNACVTQSHHPRQGERLGLWECRYAQYDETSYWNFY